VSLHPEQSRRQESFQHCFPDIWLMNIEVAVRLRRWQETGLASSLWDLRETLTSLEFSLISTSADDGVLGDRRSNSWSCVLISFGCYWDR
jgi:hypothetical protein